MNDKPKCPVFGCNIPRGIAHEHPAGVSAVMRDPAQPLNASERAELEQLRAHVRQAELLTAARMPGVYVVPDDAAIHAGRKLRDALLLAGQLKAVEDIEQSISIEPLVWKSRDPSSIPADQLKAFSDATLHGTGFTIDGKHIPVGDVFKFESDDHPAPRRTLAQSIGKFMSWMFSIPALLLLAFAIGNHYGWWI